MTLLAFTSGYADDTGDKSSGTIVDLSFYTDIEDAINALIHSTTNTTVTPADIIDEVVAARGNAANLDARLSTIIDDDGNFITPADIPDNNALAAAVGGINLCWNGHFRQWSGGITSAPDGFTLSGAGAAIERTGLSESDTFGFGAGPKAAKITRSGADVTLTWSLVPSAVWAYWDRLEGLVFTAAILGKTAVSDSFLRLQIDDGATTSESSYHPGDNTEAILPVKHTISSSATKLDVVVQFNSTDGAAYIGGLRMMFGDFLINDFYLDPTHFVGDSDVLAPGYIEGTQFVLPGGVTFDTSPNFLSTGLIVPGSTSKENGPFCKFTSYWFGVDNHDLTGTGNGAGAETVLNPTSTLPAGTIDNGTVLCIRASGSFANNADADKQIRVRLGTTTLTGSLLFDSGALTAQNNTWTLEVRIYRNSDTDISAIADFDWASSTGGSPGHITQHTSVTTEDLSVENLVEITGVGTTASDVLLKEWAPRFN